MTASRPRFVRPALAGATMVAATLFSAGAMTAPAGDPMTEQTPPTAPGIERLDPALDRLLAPDTKIETLAEGYEWSEGPKTRRWKAMEFRNVRTACGTRKVSCGSM